MRLANLSHIYIYDGVFADRLAGEPTHHIYIYIYDVVYADRLTGEPTHHIYIYILSELCSRD